MSRQTEVLPFVVERLGAENPGCAVILQGSVQHGYERPESDIDLFVITEEGDSMRVDLDRVVEGVRVQVFYWPSRPLGTEMEKEPYLFYSLSHGRVLADPRGLAARHQSVGRRYFRDHPEMVRLWKDQLADIRRTRLEGSYKDGMFHIAAHTRPSHPGWDDWAKCLRREAGSPGRQQK